MRPGGFAFDFRRALDSRGRRSRDGATFHGVRDEARLEELLDLVGAADGRRNSHEAGHHRANRERSERQRHRPGRFVRSVPQPVAVRRGVLRMAVTGMRMIMVMRLCRPVRHFMVVLMRLAVRVGIGRMRDAMHRSGVRGGRCRVLPLGPAIRSEKRQRHQPVHVERGHQGGEDGDHPERLVHEERAKENFVLAEEARENRDAGDRERAREHRDERGRHVAPQAAHSAHVLLAAHGVNHRSAAEEKQRFEERMRHQMERAGGKRADCHGEKHVAELRHGRVRQHALDVVLHQTDRGRHQRRERSNDHHDEAHHRRV